MIICTDIPFFKYNPIEVSVQQSVEMINDACIKNDRLEVVNVESIFSPGFLGFGRTQVGGRVWFREMTEGKK